MALSDEQIWASDAIMRANAAAGLPMPILGMLARTIESEVRTQDEALIRKMLDVLEYVRDTPTDQYESKKALADAQIVITAARARLPPPPTA